MVLREYLFASHGTTLVLNMLQWVLLLYKTHQLLLITKHIQSSECQPTPMGGALPKVFGQDVLWKNSGSKCINIFLNEDKHQRRMNFKYRKIWSNIFHRALLDILVNMALLYRLNISKISSSNPSKPTLSYRLTYLFIWAVCGCGCFDLYGRGGGCMCPLGLCFLHNNNIWLGTCSSCNTTCCR